MEEVSTIKGWLATERKGEINIEYKDIDSILTEDLGYVNIVTEDVYSSLNNTDEDEYENELDFFEENNFEVEDSEEEILNESFSRHFNEDEMSKLMMFFTGGVELFEMGERMVFLLEETSATTIDEVLVHLANLRISGC